VVRSIDPGIPFFEFKDMWTRIFTLNTGISELIVRLKKHYRLLLLSNTNEMHFDYARDAFTILREFDDHVLSYEVGERKPHARIYAVALERAGCPPRRCVYIDDIEENVEAARVLGINGIVFRNTRQLQSELRALNVRI
jgi:putative hydrolase of the HAD superfamily